MTTSIGPTTVITRGMPAGLQVYLVFSPCAPRSCSARLASKIVWYSAVSGAAWPRPMGLVWSHGLPGRSDAFGGFFHWPDQSGYFVSSSAQAGTTVMPSATRAMAPIGLRSDIIVPPTSMPQYNTGDFFGIIVVGIRCRVPGRSEAGHAMAHTLFDNIVDAHLVTRSADGRYLIYHYLH